MKRLKEFERRLDGNMYNGAGRYATRYILRRINSNMSPSKIQLDWEKVHIEHIYPIKFRAEWKDTDFRDNAHKLGNLCLLPAKTNYQCGNASWETKKSIYRSNKDKEMVPFAITISTIADHSRW